MSDEKIIEFTVHFVMRLQVRHSHWAYWLWRYGMYALMLWQGPKIPHAMVNGRNSLKSINSTYKRNPRGCNQ